MITNKLLFFRWSNRKLSEQLRNNGTVKTNRRVSGRQSSRIDGVLQKSRRSLQLHYPLLHVKCTKWYKCTNRVCKMVLSNSTMHGRHEGGKEWRKGVLRGARRSWRMFCLLWNCIISWATSWEIHRNKKENDLEVCRNMKKQCSFKNFVLENDYRSIVILSKFFFENVFVHDICK